MTRLLKEPLLIFSITLLLGAQISVFVSFLLPVKVSAALDWTSASTGRSAEIVHGFIERCSDGRLGETGALADKIDANRKVTGDVFHHSEGGTLGTDNHYGEVTVGLSNLFDDDNNKRQCQNLSIEATKILYGSLNAFLEKFYNQNGNNWVRDSAWTDDSKIVADMRAQAVSKGYYHELNGEQYPRDTMAYRYNALRPIFDKCFEKDDAQNDAQYFFLNLEGVKYDFKKDQENKRYPVGLIMDKGNANGGTWSCREFRDKIVANKDYFREVMYSEDELAEEETEETAEVKISQMLELFNSVETPFNNCFAVLGSPAGKAAYSNNPELVRMAIAAWLALGGNDAVGGGTTQAAQNFIQPGKLQDFKSCLAHDDQYGQTLRDVLNIEEDETRDVDDSIGEASEADATCESEGGALGWILCKVLDLGDNILSALDGFVQNLLEIPNSYTDQPELENAWRTIRNIAYIILVPIALVMVIGTALGFEFISAYTVKRALPRLVIATIFIALSFDIVELLVTMTNNIGKGVGNIILSAFGADTGISLKDVFDSTGSNSAGANAGQIGLAALVAGGTLFGIAAVASLGILISYVFVAIVGLLMGFFLLSLRQMLIIFLMLMAPVAILAWIFPGNDKLWKLWWGTFSKLLLLYPLIMVLVASGKSLALVADSAAGGSFVVTFIKLVAYIGPYFMIPAMFKFAGGAFATISGMANNRSKGLFDRNKKYRGQKMSKNWHDTKAGDKAWRPQSFNNAGRRIGAGWSGRYGIGERGRQALAQNAQVNADEALKNSPKLQKLAFNDDGNAVMALSGGNRAGAEQAARELFTDEHGVYDADRGEAAVAAAAAVGFNRSNARAAMTTLAQNKSRSVAVGQRGRDQVYNGIRRLSGGNDQEAADLRDNFAYHSSGAGRGDLGATGNWYNPVSGDATPYTSLAGFERTGLYQAANGHQNGIIGAREDALAAIATGDNNDLHRAAVHREELGAMLTNATGPARDAIAESIRILDNNTDLQAYRSTQSGELEIDPVTGAKRPRMTRDAIDMQRVNPSHSTYDATYAATFNAEELAQGFTIRHETMADRARREARVYEPPNPNR